MQIYGNTMSMTAKALDYLWARETAISNNIANVETPNYKAKYVTFEEEFKSKLEAAALSGNAEDIQKAIQSTNYEIKQSAQASTRQDGNNVNADTEIINLTQTAFQYQYLLSSINSDITRLNTVIRGQ